MCTVSIFAQAKGVLVTMNRDEQRVRPESPGPYISDDCVFPVDSMSGGTWCGLHRKGYALTLLNRYESEAQHQGSDSRGQIIPELLELDDISAITRYMVMPNLYRFSPFDLLRIDSVSLQHFFWDGEACRLSESSIRQTPFFFTSSSERTAEVIAYRQRLFSAFLDRCPEPTPSQILGDFHCLRDAEFPKDGVCVDRPKVHTKSICQIQMKNESASFNYWPEADMNQSLRAEEAKGPIGTTYYRNLELAEECSQMRK